MAANMKLSVKIGLGFAALILIACALGGLAVFNMTQVKTVANVMKDEAVPSVKVANNVERHSLLTMYEARGFALSEEASYKDKATKLLATVFDDLKEAKDLAGKHDMKELLEAAGAAENKAKDYETLFKQTADTIALMDEDRKKMNEAAAKYMALCDEFLKSQNEALTEEINEGAAADKLKQRHQKITWCNTVIDYGNAARLAAWKSQALRDPKIIQDAQSTFEKIDATLDDLKKVTFKEANLKEIENCRAAGHAYKDGMNGLLKNWLTLQDIGAKRGIVAEEVLSQAQKTAEQGMTTTANGANNAANSLATASTVMITGLSIGVLVGILLAVFITRSITGPINRVIAGLTTGSEQVTAASGQVASSSQQMAQGASEQASSLEETSSSLEEMASMTRQNADNANQANSVAKQAADLAGTGVESMKRMTDAIDKIKNSAAETAKIIKTIDEIAFQTNLLALNAAVEAARAGEAGKGFAVVAEEVRNLARRSAEAAKNTADLIEGAQKNAEAGVNVTAEVAKNLSGIKENAGKVATLIAEIAAASKEQSQGIDQVNTAVSEMDKVVQQNAANAEESSSAAEELSSQAEELNTMVADLTMIVTGSTTQAVASTKHGRRAPGKEDHHLKEAVHSMLSHKSTAPAKKSEAPKMVAAAKPSKAEEVIPLDEEELKKF